MKVKLNNFFTDEAGQAVTELALALPVLLLVVLAIVDFGRFMNYWNDENHVANLGARAAAVGNWPQCTPPGSTIPQTYTQLSDYIKCQVGADSTNLQNGGSGNGVQSPGVCVDIKSPATPGDPSGIGMPVTVKVKASYSFLPWNGTWSGSGLTAPIGFTGQATMRLEQPLAAGVTNTTIC